MLFTNRPIQRLISHVSFVILLIVLLSASQSVFAQKPQVFPVARLLSLPGANTTSASPSLSQATEIERRAFEGTNKARLQKGLAPLEWDPELYRMARIHSESMSRRGYFAHETPEGLRLKDRAHAVGIQHFRVLGENIAYNQGYDDPGAFAVERWMISPGHRANILNSEFERSAVGSFVASDGTVYLTQEFIKR